MRLRFDHKRQRQHVIDVEFVNENSENENLAINTYYFRQNTLYMKSNSKGDTFYNSNFKDGTLIYVGDLKSLN